MFWGAPYNDLYGEDLLKRVPLSGKTIVRFFFFSTIGKKCLEIRKFAKFQSDLLKTNEDIARPQSREILQTFVWWGVGDSLGPSPPPPTTTPSRTNVSRFSQLYGAMSSHN